MLVPFGYRKKWEDQGLVFILGGRYLSSFGTLGVLGDLGYPAEDTLRRPTGSVRLNLLENEDQLRS